jgi:hypothetical protein
MPELAIDIDTLGRATEIERDQVLCCDIIPFLWGDIPSCTEGECCHVMHQFKDHVIALLDHALNGVLVQNSSH